MMEKPKGRVQNSNTALGLSKVDFVEAQKMIFKLKVTASDF